MKLKDWADSEGIAYITAWSWFKAGKLPYPSTRTPTGMLLIHPPQEQALNPAKAKQNHKVCIYARVSSHDKKEDLKRQVERLKEFSLARGWEVENVVSEIASGMNDKRPKLKKLLDSKPGRILVEHKDRLTRFGFNYFEALLPMIGCELVVADRDAEEKADVIKDLIAIIYSFSARIYGMRKAKQKTALMKKVLEA